MVGWCWVEVDTGHVDTFIKFLPAFSVIVISCLMLVWLKQIRFRCWQKILEVGPVAVAEIRLRLFAEVGGHRILKHNGVARWCWFSLEHNPLLPSKIRGEFWKSQISQWLAYLSRDSHGDWGTEGMMSGGYVVSISCMQTCLVKEYQWSVMKKIMKWHSWPKILWNWWYWIKKVKGDSHFRQSASRARPPGPPAKPKNRIWKGRVLSLSQQ